MALPNTLTPINTISKVRGVNQPNLYIQETVSQTWTRVDISLWVWGGNIDGNKGTEHKFTIQNWDNKNHWKLDIKPYVMEKLPKPRVSEDATEYDAHTMSCSIFFGYLYRVYNGNTLVKEMWTNSTNSNNQVWLATWGTELRSNLSVFGSGLQLDLNAEENGIPYYLSKEQIYSRYTFPIDILPNYRFTFPINSSETSITYSEPTSEVDCHQKYWIGFIDRYGLYTLMPLGGKVQATFDKTSEKYMHSNTSQYGDTRDEMSWGNYSEHNIQRQITWNVNTPYFTSKDYEMYSSILYSPFIWLHNRQTGNSVRVRINGTQTLKKREYERLLSYQFQLEEMQKL